MAIDTTIMTSPMWDMYHVFTENSHWLCRELKGENLDTVKKLNNTILAECKKNWEYVYPHKKFLLMYYTAERVKELLEKGNVVLAEEITFEFMNAIETAHIARWCARMGWDQNDPKVQDLISEKPEKESGAA